MDPITLITAAIFLIQQGVKIRDVLMKNNEWTPEQEEEFNKLRQSAYASDHWKPHGPLKPKP